MSSSSQARREKIPATFRRITLAVACLWIAGALLLWYLGYFDVTKTVTQILGLVGVGVGLVMAYYKTRG